MERDGRLAPSGFDADAGESAQELHAFMPEHHERVRRLMEKHRTMMRM